METETEERGKKRVISIFGPIRGLLRLQTQSQKGKSRQVKRETSKETLVTQMETKIETMIETEVRLGPRNPAIACYVHFLAPFAASRISGLA